WYAVFFPHSGPYKSGVFKFVITFPNDYPDSPPRIFFLTEMFHPLVDAISKEFEYLRRAKFTVTKLLRYLKKCFSENGLKALKAEECVNIDAWKFYNNEHSTYIQLASQFAQQSLTNGTLYDHYTDDNSIRFSELSDERFGICLFHSLII
ncbi:ubiquitin-conjugating enzyme/RWD-like protein, partial [Paraphysoderma sedebokerense]